MVYKQIAQKVYDLHLGTNKNIVVIGHSLSGKVAVLFMIKLFGEKLLIGLKAYQTCRCWSFTAPPCFGLLVKMPCWLRSTTYSFVHHVDVVPRCSLNNVAKQHWPSSKMTSLRSRPRSVSPTSASTIRGSSSTCPTS